MQRNGRLTNTELAEQLGLSPSPCLRRVKNLEGSGIIQRYVALLSPAHIGLGLEAFVRVTLEKRGNAHLQSFSSTVQDWPEVVNCFAMTGEMDYLLHVHFEDLEHFSRFVLNELLSHPGVDDVKSSFVLNAIKRTTALPLSQLHNPKT